MVRVRRSIAALVVALVVAVAVPAIAQQGITDAQFAALQTIRAQYPATLTPDQIGAMLNAWAWQFRSDGTSDGLGMQRKDAGTAAVQPTTGLHVWNGIRFVRNRQHFGQDVLSGASIGLATPTRGTVGPADPNTFVAAVDPAGGQSPPPPPPGDFATKADLVELHTTLWNEVSGALGDVRGLRDRDVAEAEAARRLIASELSTLSARIATLEAGQTGGGSAPPASDEQLLILRQMLAILQQAAKRLGIQ